MDPDEQGIDLESLEREMSSKEQENQYLRSRNFGLSDNMEGNFLPKPDSNIIEYKLSAEELLGRIEHYLRGDVLRTRTNENGEVESYYSTPTKKITVLVLQEEDGSLAYYVNEFSDITNEEEWRVVYVQNQQGEEEPIQEDYGKNLAVKLKNRLRVKKIQKVGYTTREIPDVERLNLSDYGVTEIMNTLSMYITKETFLSYYKEDRINEIMADIGDELNKFLYVNGRQMGLDTEYKKTKYPLMVVTILHAIESAYRRSINGNENKGTREGIIITQHQPQNNPFPMMQPRKNRWNMFKPSTW